RPSPSRPNRAAARRRGTRRARAGTRRPRATSRTPRRAPRAIGPPTETSEHATGCAGAASSYEPPSRTAGGAGAPRGGAPAGPAREEASPGIAAAELERGPVRGRRLFGATGAAQQVRARSVVGL